MPANPADIVRATRPARIVRWTDDALHAELPAARDGLAEPDEGFFESASDAATALAAKADLIGRPVRRFSVTAEGDLAVDPLTAIPSAALSDPSLGISGTGLVTRIEIDLEGERVALELLV